MINAFITVRSTSSRLPGKCFLPFGEFNVIEHIIRRCLHYGLNPIICTTEDVEDDPICELAAKLNIRFFRGSTKNKLKRWRDCCREFDLDNFHTVDADDPFFDGKLIKKSMEKLNEGYDVIKPTLFSSSGGGSVGYSFTSDIVEIVCKGLDEDEDTEMVWRFFEKIQKLNFFTLLETNGNLPQKLRLTLDYIEDYWLLESVRRILGNFAEREDVDKLFIDNPDLYKINWFRNEEWKEGQQNKNPDKN